MRSKIFRRFVFIVTLSLSLVLNSQAQRREKYLVTIVQQPQSPIEILEAGVYPIDTPNLFKWVRFKNRSNASIIEYELIGIQTTGKGHFGTSRWGSRAFKPESPGVLLEECLFKPGEVKSDGLLTAEEVEKLRAKISKLPEFKPIEESDFPMKIEFLVKRAVLEDGTVFSAEELIEALERFRR
jgi:hypothetical protein